MKTIHLPALLAALLLPGMALAHAGAHPAGNAFASGLLHPVSGTDHLLAMLAVGIWAASIGGRARWSLPATFVTAMILGAGLGLAGISLPLVEPMILASSILIGLVLALALRPGVTAALAATGLFGLMHGFAHGAEAPAEGLMAFAAGFVLATATLHLGGLLLGRLTATRWLGAATAIAGLGLALA